MRIYRFKSFNENFEDDYTSWRRSLEEEERNAFKNRRRIGFRIGGSQEPLAIDDKARQRYDLLNDKIKIQEDNVRKMKSNNDPSFEVESNQLNQMKRVRDKIKEENKFESLNHLKRFREWFN